MRKSVKELEKLWDKFARSGKIAAYLEYKKAKNDFNENDSF